MPSPKIPRSRIDSSQIEGKKYGTTTTKVTIQGVAEFGPQIRRGDKEDIQVIEFQEAWSPSNRSAASYTQSGSIELITHRNREMYWGTIEGEPHVLEAPLLVLN
ncbi:hypothetical protein TNCV_4792231 [Trichonephila clavipes]|nr:hypothetical protein TNCV_4792231 [Trichonephila clavipes]